MKYSTTVIKQQFVCTLFNIVIIFSRGHEYYTGLKQVKGESVFTELNNELLGTWNKWGSVTGGTCTVYSNEGGEWVWHTNTCDLPCLYICEYIVPTPGMMMLVDLVLVKKATHIKVINRKFKKFPLILIFLPFIVSF